RAEIASLDDPTTPEREAELADDVGLAMLVVLDTLGPAERLAFVLHDMFAVPFEEIAPMIERTPTAARQLASRARRRVRGASTPNADHDRQRRVVEAFLAASRSGDFEALLALLHPDVVLRADATADATAGAAPGRTPEPVVRRGAGDVARGARIASGRARFSELALVNGAAGVVVGRDGRMILALDITVANDVITAIDVIADPERLRAVSI